MKKIRYPNLEAERARAGLNYDEMADRLGISRVTLWRKMESGKFDVNECRILCSMFGNSFEYLFKSSAEG